MNYKMIRSDKASNSNFIPQNKRKKFYNNPKPKAKNKTNKWNTQV